MISIGVAGKGGTGKTTVCALTILTLKRANLVPILAVDADPGSMLCEVLGVSCPQTLVDIVDEVTKKTGSVPAGMDKERFLEYRIRQAISENKDYDVLVMGRTEGPGCYCYANHLLREHLDRLEKNYPFVVMDNEAGLEHLSRRTTRKLDILFLTTIPTKTSLLSASRILAMVKDKNLDIQVGKIYLLVNEMAGQAAESFGDNLSLPRFYLPFDRELLLRSEEGRGLLDLPDNSPSLATIRENLFSILSSLKKDGQ